MWRSYVICVTKQRQLLRNVNHRHFVSRGNLSTSTSDFFRAKLKEPSLSGKEIVTVFNCSWTSTATIPADSPYVPTSALHNNNSHWNFVRPVAKTILSLDDG